MITKVKPFCLLCLLVISVYIIFSLVVSTYRSYFYPFYIPCDWSSNCHLENYNLKRNFCNSTKFDDGLVCPTLYAQLGGNCTYTNITNNSTKVMCKDVRTLAAAPYTLRQAQLAITRLLASFNIIAKKHGIKYWLTSGTLLGAVRHNGFIPWDNDADIEITLEEYERFFRHASYDLPGDIFFQNSESDINLRPSDPEKYIRQRHKDIGLYKRPKNPRLRDVKSCYKYCIQHGCKWHDGLMVDIFVRSSVPFRTYPLKAVLFEGIRFPIQNNWEEVLADKYGKDFMAIPQKGSKDRHGIYMADPVHSCEELTKH